MLVLSRWPLSWLMVIGRSHAIIIIGPRRMRMLRMLRMTRGMRRLSRLVRLRMLIRLTRRRVLRTWLFLRRTFRVGRLRRLRMLRTWRELRRTLRMGRPGAMRRRLLMLIMLRILRMLRRLRWMPLLQTSIIYWWSLFAMWWTSATSWALLQAIWRLPGIVVIDWRFMNCILRIDWSYVDVNQIGLWTAYVVMGRWLCRRHLLKVFVGWLNELSVWDFLSFRFLSKSIRHWLDTWWRYNAFLARFYSREVNFIEGCICNYFSRTVLWCFYPATALVIDVWTILGPQPWPPTFFWRSRAYHEVWIFNSGYSVSVNGDLFLFCVEIVQVDSVIISLPLRLKLICDMWYMDIIVKLGLFGGNFDISGYKVQVLIKSVSEFGLKFASVTNTTSAWLTSARPTYRIVLFIIKCWRRRSLLALRANFHSR